MRHPFSLVDLSIILALAIVAVVGYKYSPLLLPKADLTLAPVAGCDLNKQACHADVPGGGRIELSIAPHPIPAVKPLQVSATISGIMANKVEVDFAGSEIKMGYNRSVLAGSKGRFIGPAVLPVCVSGTMKWVATVVVTTESHSIAAPFHFEVSGR